MSKKLPKYAWNNFDHRLVIYVYKASGLAEGSSSYDPYVKIKSAKKTVFKTPPQKKTSDPVWSRFYFFENCPQSLFFQVIDAGSKKNLGEYVINDLQQLQPDVVYEFSGDLSPAKAKDSKKGMGKIHIRCIASKDPDRRELVKYMETGHYFYESYLDKMKSGDLIAYSGRGPLEDATKLRSGSNYSNLGIVLRIPDPLTQQEELFVVEITRNLSNMSDAWNPNGTINGLNVFRLQERIHQFYGSGIWWIALKNPINLKQEQSMLRYIQNIHSKPEQFYVIDPTPELPLPMQEFLYDFRIQDKYPATMSEIWAPQLIVSALTNAGVVESTIDPASSTHLIRSNSTVNNEPPSDPRVTYLQSRILLFMDHKNSGLGIRNIYYLIEKMLLPIHNNISI
eukprot:TRINITY_DN3109_c0_g1_i6.p1 TRINITY_DN3109_c0_g1~~TRINITY_DN3109_c0_g1_i6.p1  ORF type:complete len:395 (+),score=50.50 TRINITY_DN3109_c0_g1_i6:252-1436(+)